MGINLGTRIFTWLRGEEIGQDSAGNRYYREKGGGKVHPDSLRRERRWVIYEGEVEASRVPPEWHGWLHHTMADPPDPKTTRRHAWQQPHEPNFTGTAKAYRPPGSTLASGRRSKATGDYEAWQPD